MIDYYGAIVSTISLLLNILRDILDKPNLKVSVTKRGSIGNIDEMLVVFTAINIGRRTIILSEAGVNLREYHEIIFDSKIGLPRGLKEGERYSFERKLQLLKNQFEGKSPKYFWFKDNTGKKHKCDFDALTGLI